MWRSAVHRRHADTRAGRVCLHELQGQSPEEIVTSFPQLSLAGVHAALSYYYDHREEIENAAKAERAATDQARATHASKLLSKLNGPDDDAVWP